MKELLRRGTLGSVALLALVVIGAGATFASAGGGPWDIPDGSDAPLEEPFQEVELPPLLALDPLHCTMDYGRSDPEKYTIVCSAPWIDGYDVNTWPAPGAAGGVSETNCNSNTGSDHRTCNKMHEWHPDQCPAPAGPPNYHVPGSGPEGGPPASPGGLGPTPPGGNVVTTDDTARSRSQRHRRAAGGRANERHGFATPDRATTPRSSRRSRGPAPPRGQTSQVRRVVHPVTKGPMRPHLWCEMIRR